MKLASSTAIATALALLSGAPATLLAQGDIQDAAQRLGKPAVQQTPAIKAPGKDQATEGQPAQATPAEPEPAAAPEPGAATTPATESAASTPAPAASAPAWVKDGCPAFNAFTGMVFICGQGSMSKTANADMCMTAAANRAQTDIAGEIVGMLQEAVEKAGCLEAVVNESKTTAGNDGSSTTTRTFRARISGTRLAARWISPAGECHALVAIDLDGFQKSVFENCGAPESTRKKTYEAARAVWDARFTDK